MVRHKYGDIFGDYKIIEPLGQGGMGEVFLAQDTKLNRKVAIKCLPKSDSQEFITFEKRFQNEAKLLALLKHPNIVTVYAYGKEKDINYIVMEYVEGNTLTQEIKGKRLSIFESISILKKMVKAVGEAHQNGILHRDIKPANIIFDARREPRLVDFGISKSIVAEDNNYTKTDHFVGTINYLAPEILVGHPPSPSSDIFALGVVTLEMILGENPFTGANKFATMENIKNLKVKLPRKTRDLMPENFIKVLQKMLAKDVRKRFQSIQDLETALLEVDSSDPTEILANKKDASIEIENENELLIRLAKNGFSAAEAQVLVNVAGKIEQTQMSRATRKRNDNSGDRPTVVVSNKALRKAMTEVQGTRVSRRLEKTKNMSFERAQSKAKAKKSREKSKSITSTAITTVGKTVFTLFKPSFWFRSGIVLGGVIVLLFTVRYIQRTGDELDTEKKATLMAEISRVVGGGEKFLKDELDGMGLPSRGIASLGKALGVDTNLSVKRIPVGSQYYFLNQEYDLETGKVNYKRYHLYKVYGQDKDTDRILVKKGKDIAQGASLVSINPIVPELRYTSGDVIHHSVTLGGGYNKLFPITTGKRVKYFYRKQFSNGRFLESDQSCVVKGQEDVNLSNKDYLVWKIECEDLNPKRQHRTFTYYAPEIGMVVMRTTQFNRGGRLYERSEELVKFIKVKKPGGSRALSSDTEESQESLDSF